MLIGYNGTGANISAMVTGGFTCFNMLNFETKIIFGHFLGMIKVKNATDLCQFRNEMVIFLVISGMPVHHGNALAITNLGYLIPLPITGENMIYLYLFQDSVNL